MAFNWKTFQTRTLTAVVFAAVMLTGLLWNHWSFLILFSVIHFGCWWEYLALLEKIHHQRFHPYLKMGMMAIGYGLMLRFCGPVYAIGGYQLAGNLALPVSAAGFALVVLGIFQKNQVSVPSFGAAALGWLYISLSWGLMLYLRASDFVLEQVGEKIIDRVWFYPVLVIAAIWINDTMAYIVGSLIGKRPLSPISPKKTWEGTIGGIILSVAAITLFGYFSSSSYQHSFSKLKDWIFIPLIASIIGTLGDLLESKLKRLADVKDSGHFMPGHGGFLDRFDSLLLATPFVWVYVMFFS